MIRLNLLSHLNWLWLFLGCFFFPNISQATVSQSFTLQQGEAKTISLGAGIKNVFIADPAIADVQLQPNGQLIIFAKKSGYTTLVSGGDKAGTHTQYQIIVMQNGSRLEEQLRQKLKEPGIRVIGNLQGVILSGEVSRIESVYQAQEIAEQFSKKDQIQNQIKVRSSTQVYLKVKVAEVQRSALSKLGFNWDLTLKSDPLAVGVMTGRSIYDATNNSFLRDTSPNPASSIGFHNILQSSQTVLNMLLDALDQDGLASVLAEPTLVAQSGQEATFLVGGEFPYPVPSDTTVSISFKEFGIRLTFLPTVLSNNNIHVKVSPEVSELDYSNSLRMNLANNQTATVPALRVRRFSTALELTSGQSFAIAGLFSKNVSDTLQEYPAIAKIPIIGALFRSREFRNNQTELVITVTPYFVEPIGPSQITLPTDGVIVPSTFEAYVLGRKWRRPPAARQYPKAGFFVE